jgi:hypothetical protein
MEQIIVATKQTASVRLISIVWILYPPAYDAHQVNLVTPFAENACTREPLMDKGRRAGLESYHSWQVFVPAASAPDLDFGQNQDLNAHADAAHPKPDFLTQYMSKACQFRGSILMAFMRIFDAERWQRSTRSDVIPKGLPPTGMTQVKSSTWPAARHCSWR